MLKEYEVENMGYRFTGMTAYANNKAGADYNKAQAMAIKKAYKGADYKIVNHYCDGMLGTSRWKRIYGNDIFMKALNEENRRNF